MHKKLVTISCFIATMVSLDTLVATQLITGDSSTSGQTFSFPLSTHVYERVTGRLFVGAQQPTTGTAASYALAVSAADVTSFSPLIPAVSATVNGVAAPNPLLGAQIDQLALMTYNSTYQFIVAVPHAMPGTAYLMQNGVFPNITTLSLLSTGVLHDANNNPTPRIAALTTNVSVTSPMSSSSLPAGLQPGMAIFAAVTNQTGIFGQPGSGIATAVVQTDTTAKNLSLSQLVTTPLDVNSSVITIGSPLTAMANSVILKNSINAATYVVAGTSNQIVLPLSKVYVGLQLQGGAGASDGVQAVVTFDGFMLSNNAFITTAPVLTSLAPTAAITADSIIAATGSHATVNIYNIVTMTTTTHLRYLIVVGGVAPQGAQRTVFALPLVTESGLLANVNALPSTIFSSQNFFSMRTLPAAAQAGDLYNSTSIPAQVGGGVLPGDVADISVAGDTVFASITSATTTNPGIFYSQALFNAMGMIKGWTQWQRVGNAFSSTAGLALDEHTGNFWSIGTTVNNGTTVQRTVWEKPQQSAPQFLQQAFNGVQGGIQGLFEFTVTTSVFDQTTHPLAVTIATGNNQVTMVQGAQKVNGIIQPTTDFSNGFSQTNGTLQGFAPGVSWLNLSGGVLHDIGPIIAATIISDGTYAWFAVGGAGGVAVLAHPDGTGWLVSSGLQSGFVGLTADMSWIRIGNYSAVRKLIANQNALYVLTQTTLERSNLSPSQIQQGTNIGRVTLAQGGNLPGGMHSFLSDALISKKIGLLATSSGLLRVGNGSDITTAPNAAAVGWTTIPLPLSVGPVTRLFGMSVTGLAQDMVQVSPLVSGNVYVLNGYVGYNQSRVYRFSFNYTGVIDDTTIQPLPDVQINGPASFFLTFGRYRNHITTDGSIFAVSRSKYLTKSGYLELLAPTWMVTPAAALTDANKVVIDATAHSVGHMIRSSVTGSWLVPGEFGLFVNE